MLPLYDRLPFLYIDEKIVKDREEEINRKYKEKREKENKVDIEMENGKNGDNFQDAGFKGESEDAFDPITPEAAPEVNADAQTENEDVKVEL